VVKGREQQTVNNVPQTTNSESSVVEGNLPPANLEKMTQSSSGLDLNTTTAESNGSSAIASTTAGIAGGLGN